MSEKKFGARTFRVQKMLATRALVMQARLFRVIGGAAEKLPKVIGAYVAGKDDAEKMEANAAALQAISDIFQKTEPEALAALVADLIATAEIRQDSGDYTWCEIDRDFSDPYDGELIPFVVWVLQEQFSDFFTGALAIGSLKLTRKA